MSFRDKLTKFKICLIMTYQLMTWAIIAVRMIYYLAFILNEQNQMSGYRRSGAH